MTFGGHPLYLYNLNFFIIILRTGKENIKNEEQKNKRCRVMGWILSLCMIFTMLPVSVFAENDYPDDIEIDATFDGFAMDIFLMISEFKVDQHHIFKAQQKDMLQDKFIT